MMDPKNKYHPFPKVEYSNRTWPDNRIETSPAWCSVDLRDGNQSLMTPMNLEQKLAFFKLLVETGFKEIEVGFPSASDTEYRFLRQLVDDALIPDDVSVQVLCQAREHLIERTMMSLKGVKNAIFHLYNSTSVAQRKIVFQKSKEEIIEIALQGIRWIKQYQHLCDSNITLQYSPESFTGTELPFALEICEAVIEEWGGDEKVIINLPATVELSTPNLYADMIEWFAQNTRYRDRIILSVHTHNDRGTGVAASELALMAGADRVEGTLFGNGERTGNVDLVTLGLNLFTQGVDPNLDLQNIDHLVQVYEQCTGMTLHERHPYVGDLVYTAFSGSHQDAIKKGMAFQNEKTDPLWEVPYLPIDPTDLGRTYEAIIRITSQSGKGGAAYIMESEYGCLLPKKMLPEFSSYVQKVADRTGEEVKPSMVWDVFQTTYLDTTGTLEFKSFESSPADNNLTACKVVFSSAGEERVLHGTGNGPIDACKNAMKSVVPAFTLLSYYEHSLDQGSESKAISYIELKVGDWTGFGVGVDTNINIASIKALFCALNRSTQSSQ